MNKIILNKLINNNKMQFQGDFDSNIYEFRMWRNT